MSRSSRPQAASHAIPTLVRGMPLASNSFMRSLTTWTVATTCALALACSSPSAKTTLPAASGPPAAEAHADSTPEAPSDAVQIEMRNVRLHLADGIALDVATLRGRMIPRQKGRPPIFDDQRSYVLAIAEADLAMDLPSLERLMNDRVFASDDAPIRGVHVKAGDDGRLEISGRLRKGVPVPFSTKVDVAAADDGRLRLHADSFKALGLPLKKVLGAVGVELDDLVTPDDPDVVAVDDNNLLVTPGRALPPPEVRGRLARAALARGRLVLSYAQPGGGHPARLTPSRPRANYVYFSGGRITFGKLTMTRSDLQLIDLDPRDAFDFFPARYSRQLIAGYSKNTPRGGLETYMPDYGDLR